jgi:hypothetical protein
MTSATPDTSTVTYAAHDTTCTPTTALCMPNMPCMPPIPSSYQVCIAQNGIQACPTTTFTQQHVVGTGVTFGCGTGCGCQWPSTCTGTMQLFTDSSCMNGEYDVQASSAGLCVAHGSGEADSYNSYHYVANQPNVSCTPTGSSSPQNLALSNVQTICCAQ